MNELQIKVLGLLKDIDKLCRDNGIEYYLTAGTLLGAIRHKGFIPWDDDADVIMTRDNWEKFLSSTKDQLPKDIVINSQYTNPSLAMTANHYVDTHTTAIYRYDVTNPERNGIMLDVIIMDPVPEGAKAKNEYITALAEHTDLSTLPYQYSIRIGKNTHFAKYWNASKIVGKRKVLDHIDRHAFHYSDEESAYYVQRFSGSPHFWPKEIFGTPKYVPFEDTMLPVPERAEECLCIGFDDDWMRVPASGVAKSTHEFCVRSMTVPGKLIADDFERHVDREQLLNTYVERKKRMVAGTEDRFQTELKKDCFTSSLIKLRVERKLEGIDLRELTDKRDYEALNELFSEYLSVQCTSRFLGSSALSGWMNWYRKCNPMLIDIGDEPLYAVLVLLMHEQKLAWTGKLLKARKALDRPLSARLREMDGLYNAVKEAGSAYDRGLDERCREVLDQWLPTWPDDPFLWKLDLKLRVRRGLEGGPLLKAAEAGLELFPEDPELLYWKAQALFALDEREAALEIYRDLIGTTNHGLVLLHIREKLEAMLQAEPEDRVLRGLWLDVRRAQGEENVPELEPEPEPEPEPGPEPAPEPEPVPAPEPELTPVQKKRLQLLGEVAGICRKNKIKYYLFGKTLLQAARGGRYEDAHASLSVVMTAPECRKFMNAFEKNRPADRYLDSMDTNPMFPRFCVRYCDTDSLDFSVDRSGCGDRFGVFVTIEILRRAAKDKKQDRKDLLLEQGWEASLNMKRYDPQIDKARRQVEAQCAVLGRERVAKRLFRRFMDGPKAAKKDNYYIKLFWKPRTFYPSYLFKFTQGITLEGKKFQTMKLYRQYLAKAYGAKWKTRRFPMTKAPGVGHIVDADIPCGEYLDRLAKDGVDREAYWKLWRRDNRRWAKVKALGTETDRYWDIMCLCGERYRLWEKYMPMRPYLIELYKDGKAKKLAQVLNDYYATALAFSKKGLGLCFDKKIFEMLEYALLATGKAKQAAEIRKKVPKQDWKPLPAPYKIGGKGLRQAVQDDIPAILAYLKRHVQDCIYMYIDIAKYGLDNPNMKIWLDADNDGVGLVVMKYHTGMSVYSARKKWDAKGTARLIENEKAASVTGPRAQIERLMKLLGDRYGAEYGAVFRFTNHRDYGMDELVETAGPEDTPECARLIAADEGIGSYYEVQDLAVQLAERMDTGMGRSYVIRQDGRIVAHIASYAEFKGIATTGGLIVDPAYRSGVYGGVLESYLVKRLLEEKFKVYTFVTARLRVKLLTALGNEQVGEYGKMMRRKEEPEGGEQGE